MLRPLIAALTIGVASTAATAQEAPTPTDDAIRQWVESNPEIIMDSINAYLAEAQAQEAARANQVIFDLQDEMFEAGTPTIVGNPEGTVEMVYFLDAACGFCKRMTEPLKQLVEANPDLRIVQRWVPFLTPDSRYAGIVATIVQETHPDRLADFYSALMGHPEQLDRALVDRVVGEVFDAAQTEEIVSAAAVGPLQDEAAAAIEENFSLAQRAQVQGTPFLHVRGVEENGTFRGAVGLPELQAAVDAGREIAGR